MKGFGTKKLRNGQVEMQGYFDKNLAQGKGYKRWKKIVPSA